MPVNISRPPINIREKLSELERPVGITGQSVMAANTPEEVFAVTGAGRKNFIINGDFLVDQRNSGNTQSIAANTTSVVTADRWKLDNQTDGTVQTATLSGDCPAGLKNAIRIRCTGTDTSFAAGQYVILSTQLEQRDLRVLRWGSQAAAFSTVSFYARSTIPGYTLTFEYYSHNGAQISKSFLLTSTWQRYYVVLPPNYLTSMSDGVNSAGYFNFWLAGGSSYTAGTLNTSNWKNATNNQRCDIKTGTTFMDTVNNDVFISGVQWEMGATLTPFEYRTYSQELALCQRYYERWSTTGSNFTWYTGYGYNTQLYLWLPFKVPKRTTSCTASYSTSSASTLFNAYGTSSTSGSIGALMTSAPFVVSSYFPDFSFYINLSASTYSPYGTAILWTITNNNWIAVDAEI
jgi:hypothetical protein